jgi:hypothetical protein
MCNTLCNGRLNYIARQPGQLLIPAEHRTTNPIENRNRNCLWFVKTSRELARAFFGVVDQATSSLLRAMLPKRQGRLVMRASPEF